MIKNSNYDGIIIPTYVINSKERNETLEFINQEFTGFSEFDITIVEASKHKIADVGLWKSLVKAVSMANDNNDDVIIICNDNHKFTVEYSKEFLLSNIIAANEQGVAILLGGAEGFGQVVPLTKNRLWIDAFSSCHFIVLYKKIFAKILNYKFRKIDLVDNVLSEMTSHKMILHPFISRQMNSGSLNTTAVHYITDDQLPGMLKKTGARLEKILIVYARYNEMSDCKVIQD